MIGFDWLDSLIKIVETDLALQRRAFLQDERIKSKSATRQANRIPMGQPELRRRAMQANKPDRLG